MKRGEIWTVAGGSDYSGKPRPVVILQADRFDATASITGCGLTSTDVDAPLFRVAVEPTAVNNLRTPSFVMVDKITTVPKDKVRYRVGRLSEADMAAINQAVVTFLGLTD